MKDLSMRPNDSNLPSSANLETLRAQADADFQIHYLRKLDKEGPARMAGRLSAASCLHFAALLTVFQASRVTNRSRKPFPSKRTRLTPHLFCYLVTYVF